MLVHWSPQRSDRKITYQVDAETITATLDDQSETFDFSVLPDGEAAEITSVLDPCPVLAAKRVNGELHVTLLRTVGPRPTDVSDLETWKRLWTEEVV
jgi:hypothetical protein